MSNAKEVSAEVDKWMTEVLKKTGAEVYNRMKEMTPVDTGELRGAVQIDLDDLPNSVTVFNNKEYAQRLYLEGWSQQLPQGEFQAFVASIPTIMERISRGVS